MTARPVPKPVGVAETPANYQAEISFSPAWQIGAQGDLLSGVVDAPSNKRLRRKKRKQRPVPEFELEMVQLELDVEQALEPVQSGFLFVDPEYVEPTPQVELDGMATPSFAIQLTDASGTVIHFHQQHAHNVLDAMEAQNVAVEYQCRAGYCGACRTKKLSGDVAYTTPPMAFINDNEILPCCCVPKTDLVLAL